MVEHARERGDKYENGADLQGDNGTVLVGKGLVANAAKEQRLVGFECGFLQELGQAKSGREQRLTQSWLD